MQPGVSAQRARNESSPFVSRAPKLGYCPPFDGLRGIAMSMVLLAHLSYQNFASFSASVDLFFVISGFLITTLILEEHRKTDRVDMKDFYSRRVFRLFPMLYATLVATMLGALATGKSDLIKETWNDVLAAALYVYHVVHPVGIEITQSRFPHHRPLVQLWSLSVEEHFYLVAAVITVIVVKYRLPRLLIATFASIWLFIGVARLTGHVGPRLMWMQRPDSLLVGVCVAYVHALLPPVLSDKGRRILQYLGLLAVATIVVVVGIGTGFAPYRIFVQFSPYDGKTPFSAHMYWARFGFSVCNVCIGIMLLSAVRIPASRLAKFLAWRPLREIGVRSYCIYLLHVPLAVILFEEFGTKNKFGEVEPNPGLFLVYIALLVVLTQLSHKYLEQRVMRWAKERREAKKTPLAA